MSIKFHLEDNGYMNLKIDPNIINSLKPHQKQFINDELLPLLNLNKKLILTGSFSLKLFGFEPMENVGDFDISLSDSLTEEEYLHIKDFFNFKERNPARNSYDEPTPSSHVFDPKSKMWLLEKLIKFEDNGEIFYFSIKTDIFNHEIISNNDIITLKWGDTDFNVRLVHPCITYSYRMRYALDVRGNNTNKYFQKMLSLFKDIKTYFIKYRSIQKMLIRVKEHNLSLQEDTLKNLQIKQSMASREGNFLIFFNQNFGDAKTKESEDLVW